VGFISGMKGWFNIYKSINMTYHMDKVKENNHIIFSIDAKKLLKKFNIHL